MFKLFEDKIGTLSQVGGTISLSSSMITVGAQQYRTTGSSRSIPSDIPTLAASTLYYIYAVVISGIVQLRISANVNSVGPTGFVSWRLVGAFRTDGSALFSALSPLLSSSASDFYELPVTPTLDTIAGSLPIAKLASTPFLGYGQSWQNMAGQRGIGGVYSNNTGKPICLAITVARGGISTAGWGVSVNGSANINAAFDSNSSGGNTGIGFFIVPDGSTYQVNIISEAAGLSQWYELR